MLVSTINNVRAQGMDHRTLRLYAQEVNLTTSSIARMNLFLHEIEDFNVYRGDTLRDPGFRDKTGALRQFDAVIANPPFSLKDWGADTWPADPRAFCGVPPAKNGDYAFIQHMITSMKPETGRVGVVMPHGVLFRGGEEARIRKCLVERDLLEAVIGLPPNLFYSTTIPACILVFRASKNTERMGHVLFLDGSARFAKAKNQNVMRSEDVDALVDAYKTGEGQVGADTRLVSIDEIEANDFDLNMGRYVHSAMEDASDLGTALVAYADARQVRINAEGAMLERLAAAGIDLSDLGTFSE
jgi:type I restriction enzyme M protein